MIDISKMKALAAQLRNASQEWFLDDPKEHCAVAATAIDTLLSELEAREADRRDQLTRLLTIIEKDSEWTSPRAVDWTRGVLMATLKIALAQRQEGSEG